MNKLQKKVIKNLKKDNWIVGKCDIKDNKNIIKATIKETEKQVLLTIKGREKQVLLSQLNELKDKIKKIKIS